RNQDFHPAIWHQLANLTDGFGENARAAQVVVIAIHAGDDGVLQTERGNGFGYPPRLVPRDGTGLAPGHRAKSAAPCADVPQQHEGGGAMVPALADIGTLCRLAHRVQSQTAGQLFKVVKVFPDGGLGSKPLRLGLPDWKTEFDLNKLGAGRHRLATILHAVAEIPKPDSGASGIRAPLVLQVGLYPLFDAQAALGLVVETNPKSLVRLAPADLRAHPDARQCQQGERNFQL